MFKATDHFYEIVMRFNFSKIRKSFDLCKLCFCLKEQYCGVSDLQAIKELMPSSIPSLLESLRNGIICQTMCSDTISTTLMQTGSNQTLKSG